MTAPARGTPVSRAPVPVLHLPRMASRLTHDKDLEAAIDAVADSYDREDPINNLDSAALPNKRAVIDAYNYIKPTLFMGFYSRR